MPQTTFTLNPIAANDNATVTSVQTSIWPPSAPNTLTNDVVEAAATGAAGPSYTREIFFLRFDTRTLGGTAKPVAATLQLYANILTNTNSIWLGGEYYASSNWPITTSNYTVVENPTAFDLQITAWTLNAYNSISLTNPRANVLTNDLTGLRCYLHVTTPSSTPTGDNLFSAQMRTQANPPKLVVTVEYPFLMMV